MDNIGWSRRKASVINCIFVLIASLPCVLGYNVWSNLHIIGTRDVLDSEDFLVSNLLLPLGSLVYLLFCVSKWGWGYDKYLAEANKGAGLGEDLFPVCSSGADFGDPDPGADRITDSPICTGFVTVYRTVTGFHKKTGIHEKLTGLMRYAHKNFKA